ncbi:uncharacterized protein TNCV_3677061 [Trichonephila clavipes]|nr:uncharacterized protein TNCV_3677061 [Trichonephila clavipes]
MDPLQQNLTVDDLLSENDEADNSSNSNDSFSKILLGKPSVNLFSDPPSCSVSENEICFDQSHLGNIEDNSFLGIKDMDPLKQNLPVDDLLSKNDEADNSSNSNDSFSKILLGKPSVNLFSDPPSCSVSENEICFDQSHPGNMEDNSFLGIKDMDPLQQNLTVDDLLSKNDEADNSSNSNDSFSKILLGKPSGNLFSDSPLSSVSENEICFDQSHLGNMEDNSFLGIKDMDPLQQNLTVDDLLSKNDEADNSSNSNDSFSKILLGKPSVNLFSDPPSCSVSENEICFKSQKYGR